MKKTTRLARVSRSRELTLTVHGPICDLNIATLNKEIRPHVLERMEKSLRHSASLGAKTWVLHPGTHGALSWIHKGEDWEVNLDNMKRLQSLGKDTGVEVTIENISAAHAVLGRAKDFLRLYHEWPGAPNMTLDVGHSHIKGETEKILSALGGKVSHVHVHDNNGDLDTHRAIGSGTIPWKEVFESLETTGFDGDIVVESVRGPFASYERVQKLLNSLQ